MAQHWFGGVLLFQVIFLVSLAHFGQGGRPKLCIGEACVEKVTVKPQTKVLEAYCWDICYGNKKDIYDDVCKCESIVTTLPPPCTTTYLQGALCDWSTRVCNESAYCEWRKNMSLTILASENIQGQCNCTLKETKMQDPCKWNEKETTLCSILKVRQMLYADFQCLCGLNVPTPPPSMRHVCQYTENRPAQLTPARRKRLFDGSAAYMCNYPGVVGLFLSLGAGRRSVCTATLLNEDTILFDQQCKTALKFPTYILADSYDVKTVSDKSPRVNCSSITVVDSQSAASVLFTAKLMTKLVLDDKCVQPACIPNIRIPAHLVNLDDCRVLGYGDTTDTFITGPQTKTLLEIKVKVVPTSVSSDTLEIVRDDGEHNTACLNEFSAPVVCSHKYTKEWITVGIHQYVGVICSGGSKPDTFQVTNLLSEAMGNHYYDQLKGYHPVPATVVPV